MRTRSTVGVALLGALLTVILLVMAAPAMATVAPHTAEFILNPGASATDAITATLAAQPPKVDVLFSFDLTGSMGEILGTAQADASNMMTALKAAYPTTNFTFGVASHMDYPHDYTDFFGYSEAYGDPGDYAYKLDAPLNGDTAVIQSTIDGLTLGSDRMVPRTTPGPSTSRTPTPPSAGVTVRSASWSTSATTSRTTTTSTRASPQTPGRRAAIQGATSSRARPTTSTCRPCWPP